MSIHDKLSNHFKWYDKWHEKMSHQYWHWLSFGLIVFVCFSLILNQSALTYLEIKNLSKIPLQPKVAGVQSASSFNQRQAEYFNADWSPTYGPEQAIGMWAWLENGGNAAQNEGIRQLLLEWQVYNWGREGWDLTILEGLRVREQYSPQVDGIDYCIMSGNCQFDDYDVRGIENLLNESLRNRWFFRGAGTLNNRFFDFVIRYILSEQNPGLMIQYGPSFEEWYRSVHGSTDYDGNYTEVNNCYEYYDRFYSIGYDNVQGVSECFEYNGQEYIPTHVYNSLELSRAWLYWKFNGLTTTGDGDQEMDSEYTKTFIASIEVLYDFAQDPVMKKRAKMMLDFILLDSIMETSGGLHGAPPGRTKWAFDYGGPRVYYDIYWGILPAYDGASQFYDAYVSSYRLPDLIVDIGTFEDEADDYWHWDTENNRANFCPSTGKGVYVAKYYNLGGCFERDWLLNMASSNSDYGIRIWINNLATAFANRGGDGRVNTLGDGPYYQDKNAMLVRAGGNIHILDTKTGTVYEENDVTGNLFAKDEIEGNWRFLLEGNTAVAISLGGRSTAIETAVIGTGSTEKGFYNSYDEFKTAVINNTRLTGDSFTTSQGTVITSSNYSITSSPRLEAVDNNGEYIVKWNDSNRTAIVQRHGLQCTYNFNNWSYSGNGCEGGDGTFESGGGFGDGALSRPSGGGGSGTTGRSASQIKANFNCDSKGVDIQDFGILLSHWGKTTGITNYSHHAGCSKSLDLSVNNKIDGGDMAILLSCWGIPDKDACYPAGTSSTPSSPTPPTPPTPPAPPTPPTPPVGECTDWGDCSNENCLSEDFCICGKNEGQVCDGALAGVCSEDWPTNPALTWRIDTRGYEYCMARDEGECWCACPLGQTWWQSDEGYSCQSGNAN